MTTIAPAPALPPVDYVLPDAEAPTRPLLRRVRRIGLVAFLLPTAVLTALLVRGALASGAFHWDPYFKELPGALFAGIFVAGFTAIPYFVVAGNRLSARLVASWKSHDYAWYRRAYPDKVTASGDIVCRHCTSSRLVVRNVMNRTFLRSHSCERCGKTLYYSPEQ